MIGLDTNVIVRFLTNDEVKQSAAIKSRLKQIQSAGSKAYVSKVVLLETIWVLTSSYEFSAEPIMEALNRFIQLPMIVLEEADLLSRVMALYNENGPGLADQLILADYLFNGCDTVITFDKKAQRIEGFSHV